MLKALYRTSFQLILVKTLWMKSMLMVVGWSIRLAIFVQIA